MDKLPEWRIANNGTGKHRWFLIRGRGQDAYTVPIDERYYYNKRGDLIRYASWESAQRAADKLNKEES